METLLERNAPRKLIENRISFACPHSELSLYDTYLPCSDILLQSEGMLYCGMVHGRKLMHRRSKTCSKEFEVEFVPHESFVMAPQTEVQIDFPEARLNEPTRCLTIEISSERVSRIAEQVVQPRYDLPLLGGKEGMPEEGASGMLHTHHTTGTQGLLERLFQSFTNNDPDRDIVIEYGVNELVLRLLRHQEREFVLHHSRQDPEADQINASVALLEATLEMPLDIDRLCQRACMSRSRYYEQFKKRLGCTPAELQHQLRLKKAAARLARGERVSTVCFDSGYTDLSHFNRRFRKQFGVSPSQYQMQKYSPDVSAVR